MEWEILHIPNKPPTSLELPTVDVVAATIEPKLANSLVRKLNQIYPLEDFRHVKRVRKRSIEGKAELSLVLCMSIEDGNHMAGIPNDVLQLINFYELNPFKAKVAKYAASSREEWEEQCKLWPTSYHPNTSVDGASGFSEEDSQLIFTNMKMAIQLTKSTRHADKMVNAAMIVDPLSKQIIATGCDETSLRHSCVNGLCAKPINCLEQLASISSPCYHANELANSTEDSARKFSADQCSKSYSGVSCLYPWGWTAQSPCAPNSQIDSESNYLWHPLRHAALVAIENAAARDRKLFCSSGSSESQSTPNDASQDSSDSSPAKRQKTQMAENDDMLVKECTNGLPSERPYLCTGFDIYLAWEPCTMCAMALVHQRIRRIFFAFPNPNAGALGSVYRLHGEKSLNHHYTVFRILLPEKALHDVHQNGLDSSILQN